MTKLLLIVLVTDLHPEWPTWPLFHLARWGLTCFGFKGVRSAADAVELMGVNSQSVRGACNQIRHCNRGLLFHWYNFHRLVALETQERGQSHSMGCGLHSTIMAVLTSKGHSIKCFAGKVFSLSDSKAAKGN